MAETTTPAFDPLDMNNYKVEKLPKMQKGKFEVWMARLGGPLAIIAFVWICWFCHIGFIDNLDQSLLAGTAQKRLADPAIAADYEKLSATTDEMASLEERLAALYEEWDAVLA